MTYAELAQVLGAHRSLAAMILRGLRQLTIPHVRTLSRFLVCLQIFLHPRSLS
jgi:antitoxin component HigA of HigAB toxin-antitoxin module